MKAFDLLLDDTYDLAIERGDFAAGESDAQHVELLMQTNQGEWRQDPVTGIGLSRFVQAPYGPAQAAQLSRTITIQLERDGYRVLEVDVLDLANATLNAERL